LQAVEIFRRRHRTIIANAIDYAIERRLLSTNPIRTLKWKPPRTSSAIDRRCVVNPGQARALLAAVHEAVIIFGTHLASPAAHAHSAPRATASDTISTNRVPAGQGYFRWR
jgi:hypothetical protein